MPPLVEYLATYWLTFSLIESCVSSLSSHLLWAFWVHAAPGWPEIKCLNLTAIHSGTATPKWPLTKALSCNLWEMYIKLWTIRYLTRQEGTSPNPCRPQHLAGGVVSCLSMACMCLHHPVSCRQYECGYRIIAKQGYPTLQRTLVFACLIVTCTIVYGHWSGDICHFAWHDVQILTLDSKSGQRQSSGPHWPQSAHRWISGVSGWPQRQQKDSYTWMWA